jgi:kynureninase
MVGTPPVLSLAALEVGVDIALQVDMALVRAKSLRQTQIFADLVAQECPGFGLSLVSPTNPERRGSQVCLAHPQAYPIMQALIARGVIGDFRAPDILRFGITPLYLGFTELWDAVAILRDIMTQETWRDARFRTRQKVT